MTHSLVSKILPCVVAGLVLATPLGAHAGSASKWRALITLPPPGSEESARLRALDRFVIAQQLGDVDGVTEALADTTWSEHLRAWAAARWALHGSDLPGAAREFERAARRWPATLEEADAVLSVFDRQRARLAFALGDTARAAAILARPLAAHEDAGWSALRAMLRLRRGDAAGAANEFDAAWQRADRAERTHEAFLERALAHFAAGDTLEAGEAWIDLLDALRRPEHLRAAAACWDSVPALAVAVERSPRRQEVLDWMVRLFRRADASALARTWLARTGDRAATDEEQARLFVFVAEQAYRLREHDELQAWLDRTWPVAIDDEQRAELEAYPLGVRRRGGHDEDLARGFDAIADRYAGTPRAAEARWEAAWMWELSERTQIAIDRYERYVDELPTGPFAAAAALRALLLHWREGEHAAVVQTYERLRPRLGDGLEAAAGTWLAARSYEKLGRADEAARLDDGLRRDDPASPAWREPLELVLPDDDADSRIEALFQLQAWAWRVLAADAGAAVLDADVDPELHAIDRLAELGLLIEAETRLAAWADARRSDTIAVLRACALAHRWGLPEMQGRYGWIVERRTASRSEEVAQAGLVASLPTPFARTVLTLAREQGVPAELVWAVMRRESFYDADVKSIAGAFGLLQLIPRTAAEMAERLGREAPSEEDLFVPRINLQLGIGYLAGLLREAEGDRVRAIASYNAGESNGLRWQERRRPGEPLLVAILVISYSETRAYVYHVLRHWYRYADLYGNGR